MLPGRSRARAYHLYGAGNGGCYEPDPSSSLLRSRIAAADGSAGERRLQPLTVAESRIVHDLVLGDFFFLSERQMPVDGIADVGRRGSRRYDGDGSKRVSCDEIELASSIGAPRCRSSRGARVCIDEDGHGNCERNVHDQRAGTGTDSYKDRRAGTITDSLRLAICVAKRIGRAIPEPERRSAARNVTAAARTLQPDPDAIAAVRSGCP